jgi:ribosomal protein L44E
MPEEVVMGYSNPHTRYLTLEGFATLSHRVRFLLRAWQRRTSEEEVAHRGGVSVDLLRRLLAGGRAPAERLAGLQLLSAEEPPASLLYPCRTKGCPVRFDAPDAQLRYCPECKAKAEAARKVRRYETYKALSIARPERPAKKPVLASPCPECGTTRRREGALLYCPKRCDGGLVLIKRAS